MTQRELEQMAAGLEPSIRDTFMTAVRAIIAQATIGIIAEMVRAGSVEGVMGALGITQARYAAMVEAVREAFKKAGIVATEKMPRRRDRRHSGRGYQAAIGFDLRNPRAERWLQEHSAQLVTRIIADQREAIRGVLSEGMALGHNPRRTALDIVGRVGTTGRRQGGIVGLTSQQAQFVTNARAELADPVRMADYLRRQRRDKRFDATVRKAMREGRPLSQAQIDRIAGRYADRLLAYRGEVIARTEALQALNAGRHASMQQAIEAGAVSADQVAVAWKTALDRRVRDTHRAMENETVPWGGAFTLPSGARLRYPGDTDMGAPSEEVIQCFAPWARVSMAGIKGCIARHYSGYLVELSAGGVVNLAVTPNHPVLTQRGWIPAGGVVEGDNLIYALGRDVSSSARNPNVREADSSAEEIYGSAKSLGGVVRASRRVVNLHGEIPDEDVDVVAMQSGLRDAAKAAGLKLFGNIDLAETDITKGAALVRRVLALGERIDPPRSNRGVRGSRSFFSALRGGEGRRPAVPIGNIRWGDAHVGKTSADHGAADAEFPRDGKNRVPCVEKVPHRWMKPGPLARIVIFCLRRLYSIRVVRGKAEVGQTAPDYRVTAPDSLADLVNREPGRVEGLDLGQEWGAGTKVADGVAARFATIAVTSIQRVPHVGHVYNFETDSGLILADGVITHNCRCIAEYKIDFLAGIE